MLDTDAATMTSSRSTSDEVARRQADADVRRLAADRDLPRPPRRGDWHSFVLQVDPKGGCALFIDGRLARTVERGPQLALDQPMYFWVGGRSVHTDVLIDDLALWTGLRWVVGREGEAVAR